MKVLLAGESWITEEGHTKWFTHVTLCRYEEPGIVCTGVTLQKVPDRVFDRTGTKLTCTLLATTITEQ